MLRSHCQHHTRDVSDRCCYCLYTVVKVSNYVSLPRTRFRNDCAIKHSLSSEKRIVTNFTRCVDLRVYSEADRADLSSCLAWRVVWLKLSNIIRIIDRVNVPKGRFYINVRYLLELLFCSYEEDNYPYCALANSWLANTPSHVNSNCWHKTLTGFLGKLFEATQSCRITLQLSLVIGWNGWLQLHQSSVSGHAGWLLCGWNYTPGC